MFLDIVQHNVLHWHTHRHAYSNIYRRLDADIILLNSTGRKNDDTIKIPGYIVRQNNYTNEAQNGIAICVKRTIKHRAMTHLSDKFLMIEVDTGVEKICIGTAYFPPRYGEVCVDDFRKIANMHQPTYFMGDLNAKHPVLDHRDSNLIGTFLSHMTATGQLTHLGPDFCTFVNHMGSGKPDIVLSNRNAYHNWYIERGPISPSDHLPICMRITTSPILIPIKPRLCLKRTNWDLFKDACDRIESRQLEGESVQSIDAQLHDLIEGIGEARRRATPVINYRQLPALTFTQSIRDLNAQLSALYVLVQNGVATREQRIEYNLLLLELRMHYKVEYQNMWTRLVDNTSLLQGKSFWQSVKRMLGGRPQATEYIYTPDGTVFSEPEEIANAFAERLAKQCRISSIDNAEFDYEHERTTKTRLHEYLHTHTVSAQINTEDMPLVGIAAKITTHEAKLVLKTISEKAPGESGISAEYLKQLPEHTFNCLVYLYNCCLSTGYFPQLFKKAVITMIPKASVAKSIDLFRPVSLLEVPGKLFEKIMNRRLQSFLESNDLYGPLQFGFRGERSTQSAIAIGHEITAQALSYGYKVNVVLRDVKSAFDKIWHSGLKAKLCDLGLPDCVFQFICSFLDNRKAYVRFRDVNSVEFRLKSGTPQGSSLSSTLYNIYVRDLPQGTEGCVNILYADDVSQFIIGRTSRAVAFKTSRQIEIVNNYERMWKIRTNTSKFKVICLGQRQPEIIRINGEILEAGDRGSFLGMSINTASLTTHVSSIAGRARAVVTKLRRFSGLSEKQKLLLYNAFVRPLLVYPAAPLAYISQAQLRKLQVVQNMGMRFITGHSRMDFVTIAELLNITKLPTVAEQLHKLTKSTWEKLCLTNPNLVDELITELHRREYKTRERFPSSLAGLAKRAYIV